MEQSSLSLRSRRKPLAVALCVGVGLVVAACLAAFLFWQQQAARVAVPKEVQEWAPFSIYIPSRLPSGYKVDPASFSKEEGMVVVFVAKNNVGSRIIFTEQSKPEAFDFDTFYREQVTNAKTLSDVPFPSVTAKMQGGNMWVLSMVADATWVIASSEAPLTEADGQIIAQGLSKY